MNLLGAYGSDSDEDTKKPAALPADDGKKKISFTLPIAVAPTSKKEDKDDDEDSILKRKTQANSGAGILSFLPPPKNPTAVKLAPAVKRTAEVEGTRLDESVAAVAAAAAGEASESSSQNSGVASTSGVRRTGPRLLDPSEFVPVKRAKPAPVAAAAPTAAAATTTGAPYTDSASSAIGPYPPPEGEAIGPYPPPEGAEEYEPLPEPEQYEAYLPPPALSAAAPPPGFGRIRGMPEFIDVNARDLRATQAQQMQRLTADFKQESEIQLDPLFIPSADQRRKHQLSYLVYDAKMKEQQLNEKRREAARAKAEVKAKYGW